MYTRESRMRRAALAWVDHGGRGRGGRLEDEAADMVTAGVGECEGSSPRSGVAQRAGGPHSPEENDGVNEGNAQMDVASRVVFVAVRSPACQSPHPESRVLCTHHASADELMKRNLACILALLLSATACADNSGADRADHAADEQKAITSLERVNADSESSPRMSKGATCMATGAVDKLGLDKLKQYRFLNEDLTADKYHEFVALTEVDAATWVDVILGCVPYRDVVADLVGPDAPDSAAVRRCTSAVTEGELREALVAEFSGKEDATPFSQKLARAGCGFGGD
jgi:hypothetical protein